MSRATRENRENIQPIPKANISRSIQKMGTSTRACQLVLPNKKPAVKVIASAIKLVIWAESAARRGINSVGNTVFNNKLLLPDKDDVAAVSASLNAIRGTRPENTKIT